MLLCFHKVNGIGAQQLSSRVPSLAMHSEDAESENTSFMREFSWTSVLSIQAKDIVDAFLHAYSKITAVVDHFSGMQRSEPCPVDEIGT